MSRPSARPPGRVAVIGLGLIGGSLARRLAPATELSAYDPDPATRRAAGAAGIDVAGSIGAAVTGADLVVLATPLGAYPDVLRLVAESAGAGTTLTDVASVKVPALVAARTLAGDLRWVGGHPMAGTERSGFAASDTGLFDGAAWVLCVEPDTDLGAWLALAGLVAGIGARIVPCPAAAHDAATARVSGLPHLVAAALATAGAAGGPLALQLAAGSFRDGTRVAGTGPELVAALCDGNATALAAAAAAAAAMLADAAQALRAGASVAPLVAAGHAARRRWAGLGVGPRPIRLDPTDPDLRRRLVDLGAAGGYLTAIAADGLTGHVPAAGTPPAPRCR